MLTTLRRRLRRAGRAARNQGSGLMQDFRLFTRQTREPSSFRQSRVDGMSVLVKANEDVGREIYFFQDFESEESKYILENIRETDICVDVGANIGFYSLSFAKKAVRGEVHCFEPVPLNFHMMAVNVLANAFSNVSMNNCAVGDVNCETEFCVAQDGAFSSLINTGRKVVSEILKTRVLTLDSYCRERNLTRIDVLKVDVEGAEMAVIRGATEVLSDPKRRPHLVMLELFEPMLQQFGSTLAQVEELMSGYGYRPFVLIEERLVPFTTSHHDRFYNILFLDPAKHDYEN
jgi:FkbM family methyltransferase